MYVFCSIASPYIRQFDIFWDTCPFYLKHLWVWALFSMHFKWVCLSLHLGIWVPTFLFLKSWFSWCETPVTSLGLSPTIFPKYLSGLNEWDAGAERHLPKNIFLSVMILSSCSGSLNVHQGSMLSLWKCLWMI